MTPEQARKKGWLTRGEMVLNMGMSESTFDRLGLSPVARHGQHTYYAVGETIRAVLIRRTLSRNPLLANLRDAEPEAAHAAAAAIVENVIQTAHAEQA
jgi:hypothetical protein